MRLEALYILFLDVKKHSHNFFSFCYRFIYLFSFSFFRFVLYIYFRCRTIKVQIKANGAVLPWFVCRSTRIFTYFVALQLVAVSVARERRGYTPGPHINKGCCLLSGRVSTTSSFCSAFPSIQNHIRYIYFLYILVN